MLRLIRGIVNELFPGWCSQVHLYGFSDWSKDYKDRVNMKDKSHTPDSSSGRRSATKPDPATEGVGKGGAKYHYFDDVGGVTNVHSFELSKRVYDVLGEHYRIHVH